MKNYLIYSTLFGVFSESLRYKSGVDIKFFYLIVFINTILLIVNNSNYYIPKTWGIILLVFLGLGLISIFQFDNHLNNVLFQFIGISVMSLYFYNFFFLLKLDTTDIFLKYCQFSFWLSIIGIIIFLYNYIVIRNTEFRLHSLLTEPAHFSGIVLPAFLHYSFSFRTEKLKYTIILSALLLSVSSVGYLGILCSLILLPKNIKFFKILFAASLALSLGIIIYNLSENVKMRIDDTAKAFVSYDISKVNLSTYALVSNFYVASKVFISNPIIGHGIGSHEVSHRKYIDSLDGAENFTYLIDINSSDANSLALRLLSETGILGLILVFYFIAKNYSREKYQISRAIILYFFYKLLREGHYFSEEMYFFVFLYYFNNSSLLKYEPNEYKLTKAKI